MDSGKKVAPTVINSLLEKSIRQDFGARPAHRLVDRELGPIFACITQNLQMITGK